MTVRRRGVGSHCHFGQRTSHLSSISPGGSPVGLVTRDIFRSLGLIRDDQESSGGWCLGSLEGHSVSHKGSHTLDFDFDSNCIYFLKQVYVPIKQSSSGTKGSSVKFHSLLCPRGLSQHPSLEEMQLRVAKGSSHRHSGTYMLVHEHAHTHTHTCAHMHIHLYTRTWSTRSLTHAFSNLRT